ncbi:nitric oxide-associated protein 1 isoform X2 [Phodopus roborovskii]|uniref:nitric oxide-associated protein 1 isoform X2 n=1 Tax=Phodopus roborovskii TaxID=109678 RepID=UPI0021E3E338|nr:nitric oxide-associated protein 1 isoform X2 [Phodopus roborovskii]
MLPARLACRLLCRVLRGPAPATACHGPARWLLAGKCEAAFSQSPSSLGRRLPPGSTATEDHEEGPDMEERFLFPEYVQEQDPEEQLRELRELQQRQQAEERQRLLRREERLQWKLRAGLRSLQVPELPDATVPPSGIYCSGCGAELHCQHPSLPGYLTEEKFRGVARADGGRPRTVCQRCWLLVHHRRALRLRVSRDQYLELVSAALRQPGPALVLYMVDLLDLPDTLLPDLPKLVGPKHVFVLGNKVDLLPQDAPGYLQRLRKRLWDDCIRAGLVVAPGHRGPQCPVGDEPQSERKNPNPSSTVIKDVRLISAKTGYGVEELISALQRSWRYRGDVYLVGTTNAGKSTLFNTLLESDYCTAKGSEAIDRATISPWPGTTLNLLKFPICNPTPYRLFRRQKRLKEEATKTEEDLSEEEQRQLNQLKKHAYMIGRVGRTFLHSTEQTEKVPFEFDADSLAFDMGKEPKPVVAMHQCTKQVELTPEDVKDAHWFYDTPGITKENYFKSSNRKRSGYCFASTFYCTKNICSQTKNGFIFGCYSQNRFPRGRSIGLVYSCGFQLPSCSYHFLGQGRCPI